MRSTRQGGWNLKSGMTLAPAVKPVICAFSAPHAAACRRSRLMHWLSQRASHFDARLLLLCVLIDLVFIAAHIVHNHTPWLPSPHLSIEHDRGYAEIFQYFKEIWILLLLGSVGFRRRSPLLTAWSLLFVYVLVDDAFSLHEIWGLAAAHYFGLDPLFGLRGEDFGELVVSALAASILLTLIGMTHGRASASLRAVSVDLVGLLAALACCGIVFDMLHIAAPFGVPRAVYALFEDGGEMLVMSLILARVFCAMFISRQAPWRSSS